MGVLFFIGIINNHQAIKNICVGLGFLGGIVTLYFAFNEGDPTLYTLLNFDSFLLHSLLIINSLYLVITNQVKLSIKTTLKASLFFIPLYIIFILINPLLDTDFFFTSPTNPVAKLIYDWFFTIEVGRYQFNFIYYLVSIGSTIILAIIMIGVFQGLQKVILTKDCPLKTKT